VTCAYVAKGRRCGLPAIGRCVLCSDLCCAAHSGTDVHFKVRPL
jgi:hypothetical protein